MLPTDTNNLPKEGVYKKLNLTLKSGEGLKFFKSLIDENGIIQFTKENEKNYSTGYAIEDQARALVLALKIGEGALAEKFLKLILQSIVDGRGVDPLRLADGALSGKVDNFSEASAEVFWSLAEFFTTSPEDSRIGVSLDGLKIGLLESDSPRAIAYTILGLAKLNGEDATQILGDKLVALYQQYSSDSWQWFEDKLVYANALLPWALLEAHKAISNKTFLAIGLESLEFLYRNLHLNGVPVLVGNKGWWAPGKEIPYFDQQPIDAAYLCLASLSAYKITSNEKYLHKGNFYYSWFFGNNILNKSLVRADGACFDGLGRREVNKNTGAESNICYLLATIQLAQIHLPVG